MLDIEQLSVIVALLAALSVAAERLVEIVKTAIPRLAKETNNPSREVGRRLVLQLLPIFASILTVVLAWPVLEASLSIDLSENGEWWQSSEDVAVIVAMGFLVSGGSGFWNKVVDYVREVKDLKDADKQLKEADKQLKEAAKKGQEVETIARAKDASLMDVDKAKSITGVIVNGAMDAETQNPS